MKTTSKTANKGGGKTDAAKDRPVFVPETNIYEKDEAVVIRCDMPGVDQKDIEVTFDNKVLTIEGVQTNAFPEGYELLSAEYGVGAYQRKFSIPQEIDHDNIRARVSNGVLEVELPKARKNQPKRVEVTTGN